MPENVIIPRIGLGYDSHRLIDSQPGDPVLVLGGVQIPHTKRLLGHSDADVLLHAITDALLGAACEGDIGQWFPDTSAENRGRDSAEMLQLAWAHIQKKGFRLGNIDLVVMAQKPKLLPYVSQIRHRIAEILGVDPGQIGLKAKTGEGIGLVGEERIIEVHAVALIVPIGN